MTNSKPIYITTHDGRIKGKELNDKGKCVEIDADYHPSLFLPSETPTEYKSIFDNFLERKTYRLEKHRSIIRNLNKKKKEFHGDINPKTQYTYDNYKNYTLSVSDYNVGIIDIEMEILDGGFPKIDEAPAGILSIALYSSKKKKYYVWGYKDYTPKSKDVKYFKCDDERELLKGFLKKWRKLDFDIITGWNTEGYDLPYIYWRTMNVLGEDYANMLSYYGDVRTKEWVGDFGKMQYKVYLSGVNQIDYLDIFKAFSYKYGNLPSYTLEDVSNLVLGSGKVDYHNYGTLTRLYKDNFELFIDYNIEDVVLVKELDETLNYFNIAANIAMMGRINIEDALSTVTPWDSILYVEMRNMGIIPPKMEENEKTEFMGGYVKEPLKGFYDWIVSFDVNSLYPHIIIQYNMSPETTLNDFDKTAPHYDHSGNHDYFNKEDILNNKSVYWERMNKFHKDGWETESEHSCALNGYLFTNNKLGIIPKIIMKLYRERTDVRAKMEAHERGSSEYMLLDNLQMTIKILMNSLYGAFGNKWFRYFNIDTAKAITCTGQVLIQSTENWVNNFLNDKLKTKNEDYCVAIDTDSNYFILEGIANKYKKKNPSATDDEIRKYIDKFASNKIEPVLERCFDSFAERTNAYEQAFVMKREKISKNGFWTRKKRYALLTVDNEGHIIPEGKISIKGLDCIKSDRPPLARKIMKESIHKILKESPDSARNYLRRDAKKEWFDGDLIDISTPKSCNDIDKWIENGIPRSGTPMQVKSANNFNMLLAEKDLLGEYEVIMSGNKVKLIYLEPNKYKMDAIAFINELPDEFDLGNSIDYNKQWDKTVQKSMNDIFESFGQLFDNSYELDI